MSSGNSGWPESSMATDIEASKEYRPFEDADTKVPRVLSFEQEGGKVAQVVLKPVPSTSSDEMDNATCTARTHCCHLLTKVQKQELVRVCYLSAAAILGALLRIMLAQLFGEECKNPGTVGWLKASSPLCVTADGQTEFVDGGIIFADLPANLLGCFFMGLMQDGTTLDLAIPLPVAWVSPLSSFQSMTLIHFAIKTGFCGSLTTFSSWNSEMIVLMFGSGVNRSSQFLKALFGYLVGMETALGSYVFGTTVAKWLHRLVNPQLALEADAMRERRKEGVFINRELPETERRFLHRLDFHYDSVVAGGDHMAVLAQWRESTKEARRVNHPLVSALCSIEKAVFCDHCSIPEEAEEVAIREGWDLQALRQWTTRGRLARLPRTSSAGFLLPYEHNKWFSVGIAAFFVTLILLLLILGVIQVTEMDDYLITYRTMAYSLLFAPFGAFSRWQLSGMNNGLWSPSEILSWVPLGTLAANILGSMVSISMTGLEFRHNEHQSFFVLGTLRAIRVGFAGCLTTVSTFVSEVHKFFDQGKHDHGYFYILITLGSCCIIAATFYGFLVNS